MLKNFHKFLSTNTFLKINQNFDFSKKWGKIKKNNRIFEILVPEKIKYLEQM